MSRQPGVVCEDKFLLYKLHPVDKRGSVVRAECETKLNELLKKQAGWIKQFIMQQEEVKLAAADERLKQAEDDFADAGEPLRSL